MPKKNPAERRPERCFVSARIETKLAGVGADGAAAVADGTFSAYASVFNEPHGTSAWWLDSDYMDIVKPGAFKRTLAEHKSRGSMPAMFWSHDMGGLPIGAWTSCVEDKTGLAVEGLIATKTTLGADIYQLMIVKAIPATSIGFVAVEYEIDEKAKTRTLNDLDLHEISPVAIPGDPGAQIGDVKKFDPTNIREIEAALRDAGFSATEAKRILAGGFKALTGQRDVDEAKAKREQQAFAKLMQTLKNLKGKK